MIYRFDFMKIKLEKVSNMTTVRSVTETVFTEYANLYAFDIFLTGGFTTYATYPTD